MSVLYKALAKASKARDSLQHAPEPPTPRMPLSRSRKPSRFRLVLIALGASLLLSVGGLVLFGDNILSSLDQLSEAGPPSPVLAPRLPRPPQLPGQAAAPPVAPVVPVPLTPSAVAVPPTIASPATPDGPQPPAPAPQVAIVAPPQASSAPPAVVAAYPPPPAPPTAPLPAAPPQQVAAAPALPPIAAAAPPPHPVAKPALPRQATPDEDLPAVLDRIRRQKAAPAIAEPVSVDRRRASADLTAATGESAISVAVSMPAERDDARSAYDMLLHGQYDGALGLYEKALKAAPTSLPLLLGKATAQHKLRRYSDARDSYRQVLVIDPDNREALTNMTAIIADQAPERALDDLRLLQRGHAGFSPIAAQIASIEAKGNNLPAAIVALNQAIALAPDNGLYRLNLAILQDRAGMAKEAAQSYQAALELLGSAGPLPLAVEQIRQRLKYLQGR